MVMVSAEIFSPNCGTACIHKMLKLFLKICNKFKFSPCSIVLYTVQYCYKQQTFYLYTPLKHLITVHKLL